MIELKKSGGRWGIGFAAPALAALLISGCGGNAAPRISTTQMQAINHNQRGVRFEARGEHALALEEFGAAQRINASLDNRDGTVVALVNSARVRRLLGNLAEARADIDRAITLTSPASELFAEAAFEKSQISLAGGNTAEAGEWALKSVAAEKIAKLGTRLNLLGRIMLLEGKLAEADQKAAEALRLNREHGQRAEEANSLRLLGELQGSRKMWQEAAVSFGEALAIDKELGKSTRIAADLRGLARSAVAAGDHARGEEYWQRACDVSLGSGDLKGAAGDLQEMARLREQRGDRAGAGRLLAESDRLLKAIEGAGE